MQVHIKHQKEKKCALSDLGMAADARQTGWRTSISEIADLLGLSVV